MGNEQSNDAREELNIDTIESEEEMTKEQLRRIQSLFITICDILQNTLSEMYQLKEEEEFVKMKNISFCQTLKATIVDTYLEKLCDIKLIIKNINAGFDHLKCDYQCDEQAKFASECIQEATYKLYCKKHFDVHGSLSKPPTNLKQSKKYNQKLLKELEKLLIYVQERIDYFHIEKDKKDSELYEKDKEKIDEKFGQLKHLLNTMTFRCKEIKSKTNKMKYEDLSFIKNDYDKCKNIIFDILSMIPGVCNKIESESLAQVIVNSHKGVPIEEEVKEKISSSLSNSIYDKNYQLIHIPTQSLKLFEDFENKIKNNYKIIETCIEKVRKIMDTADSLNKMFQRKLDEMENQIIDEEIEEDKVDEVEEVDDEGEKVLEKLSLRDFQFYIKKLKLKNYKAKQFREGFTISSGTYNRLGQFDYDLQNCTTDRISTCIKNVKGNCWIYIGEVKEETNDTPHGIGIIVDRFGSIREGYWNDGKLHGRGRHIYCDEDYYIGEFRKGWKNGEGTHYYWIGNRYEGRWRYGKQYGQGTLYRWNGDKYSGQWDGEEGHGEIDYADGTQYKGQWELGSFVGSKLKKHGSKALFFADRKARIYWEMKK